MFFTINNIQNYKWIRWIPLLIFIPVIIISIFAYQSFNNILTRYVNNDLYNNAKLIAGQVDNFIETTQTIIAKEATLENFKIFLKNHYDSAKGTFYIPEKYISKEEIYSILEALKAKDTLHILSYALVSSTGDVLLDTNKTNISKNESKYYYFKNVMEAKSSIVDDLRFQPKGNIYLTFATPIFDETHTIIGILRAMYSPNILQNYINAPSKALGKNAYASLFDENFLKLADGQNASTLALSSYNLLSEEQIKNLQKEQRLPKMVINDATKTEEEVANLVFELKKDEQDNINLAFFQKFVELNSTSKSTISKMVVQISTKTWYIFYTQPQQSLEQDLYARIRSLLTILVISFLIIIIISLLVVLLVYSLQTREQELSSVQKELKKLLDLERKWNKEIEDDLSLGREIQEAIQLIPQLPKDINIITDQNAAQFVSGDTYFINWNPNHNLCTFFLQDIVGHGVQAALKASISHQIAKNIWTQDNIVDRRLKNYDNQLQEFFNNLHQKATDFNALVGAEFNTRTHMLRIYRSNYVSPVLIKPDHEVFSDTSSSSLLDTTWEMKPLAIKNRTEYQHILKPGSILLILSDGYLYNSTTEMNLFRYLRSHINTPEFLKIQDLNKYLNLIKEWFSTLKNTPVDDKSIIAFQWLPESKNYIKPVSTRQNRSSDPNTSGHFTVA